MSEVERHKDPIAAFFLSSCEMKAKKKKKSRNRYFGSRLHGAILGQSAILQRERGRREDDDSQEVSLSVMILLRRFVFSG